METEDQVDSPREASSSEGTGGEGEARIDSATESASGSGATGRPANGQPSRGLGRWKRIALIALIGFAVLTLTCSAYLAATWPDVEALRTENPETTAFIERYQEREREAGREPRLRWRWVPSDRISPHLKRAAVVAEDIEFFSHEGFSVSEIRAAIDKFLSGEGELRGASTITQQLAKNLWLSPSRNPLRKLKEALLTRQLEEHLSKRRILELYLNVVEFGPGVYGAGAAAGHYFGKPAAELNQFESAQLAASLPRPSAWHPGVDSDRYWWYVNEILGRMEEAQFLWRRIGVDVQLPPAEGRPEEAPPTLDDTLGVDTLRRDAVEADTLFPDAAPADTAVADSIPADSASADTAGADTAAVDPERERRATMEPRAAGTTGSRPSNRPQFFSRSLRIQAFVPSGSATLPVTDRSLFLRTIWKVTSSSAS